ncbi:MAG: hypothetical protein UHX00_05265 [Caryophanon sp.]|nr:hypothetical protein [Caryophanon sp.]
MKVQIRRNVLTFQYEVQTREDLQGTWTTKKGFKTRAEAEQYAKTLESKVTDTKPKRQKKTK